MQLKKRNTLLVILSTIVGMIIFSVIISLIVNNLEHVIFDHNTGLLNCAGVLEDGAYFYTNFSLPKTATILLTASSHNLPPSNFDIYIMTDSQYNTYQEIWSTNGNINNATYLYKWDLTQYYNTTKAEYYLNPFIYDSLKAGNYYLVVANNYYKPGRGVYGSASIKLGAYFN